MVDLLVVAVDLLLPAAALPALAIDPLDSTRPTRLFAYVRSLRSVARGGGHRPSSSRRLEGPYHFLQAPGVMVEK